MFPNRFHRLETDVPVTISQMVETISRDGRRSPEESEDVREPLEPAGEGLHSREREEDGKRRGGQHLPGVLHDSVVHLPEVSGVVDDAGLDRLRNWLLPVHDALGDVAEHRLGLAAFQAVQHLHEIAGRRPRGRVVERVRRAAVLRGEKNFEPVLAEARIEGVVSQDRFGDLDATRSAWRGPRTAAPRRASSVCA